MRLFLQLIPVGLLMLVSQVGECRELTFPSDRVVGTLEARTIKDRGSLEELRGGWISLGAATGSVLIPDNREVMLWISADAAKDMSFLEALPPDSLYGLNLWRSCATDSQVPYIARLTGLKYLRLEDSRITGAGIAKLKSLENLVSFSYDANLSNNATDWTYGVDDESSKVFLSMPNLRSLYLRRNPVSKFALLNIAQLESLEFLGLTDTQVDVKGLELLRNLKTLTSLRFGSYDHESPISDVGASKIAQIIQLKDLGIEGSGITKDGLAQITQLPNLEKLSLGQTAISPEDFGVLESCKTLKILSVRWNTEDWGNVAPALAKIRSLEKLEQSVPVDRDGLRDLLTLPSLRHLSVYGMVDGIEFDGVGKQFGACSSLESLEIQQIPITDDELKFLVGLENLRTLVLSRTGIRGSGLSVLAHLPMLENLVLYEDSKKGPRIDVANIPPLHNLKSLSLPHLPSDARWYIGLQSVERFTCSGMVSDAEVQLLAKYWKNIASLKLGRGNVGHDGISALRTLEKLNFLYAKGDFTPQSVVKLKGLPNLQNVWIDSDNVSKGDISQLEDALQSTSINLQK